MTILEKKIRWFYDQLIKRNEDPYMSLIDFELILISSFTADHSKLTIDQKKLKPEYKDILKIAMDMKSPVEEEDT